VRFGVPCGGRSLPVERVPVRLLLESLRPEGATVQVTARGRMNSIRVEFEDGSKMITSRNAVRKVPHTEKQSSLALPAA
jgi:hypothetical protein